MFKTIFTVTKRTCESTDFKVYFEDFDKAKRFADTESKKLIGLVAHYAHHYIDGSCLYEWADKYHTISLDDYAWLTDFRVNGIGFYNNGGILTEFETYEDFQKYILHSQKDFNS